MIDTSLLNVESLNDSIAKVIPIIEAIKDNSAPAPFTYINIIISLFAAIFGLGSFYYAKKTADNVSRLSKETQIMLCEDLIRDMLAQVVRLLVLRRRIDNNELNITETFIDNNLRYWPSDIYFKQDVYNSKSKIYKKIYNLKLRMQKYNIDIDSLKKTLHKTSIDKNTIKELYISNWKNLYNAYEIYNFLSDKKKKTLLDIYVELQNDYRNELKNKKEDAYKNLYDDKHLDNNLMSDFENIIKNDINKTDIKKPVKEKMEILKESICQDASRYEQCLRISEKVDKS